MKNIYFSSINLGCKKNLVDSQHLIGSILSKSNSKYNINYYPDAYSQEVDMVFINTCGFISTSRIEMLRTIDELSQDHNKKIYIFGCGVYYFEKILKDINNDEKKDYKNIIQNPNIYKLNWTEIDSLDIDSIVKGQDRIINQNFELFDTQRAYTQIQKGYEYIKISEGCNNDCKFCIIPKIKGKNKSRSPQWIIDEAKFLMSKGAKELILISQDSSRYGTDLQQDINLLDLLEQLDSLEGNFKYRVLYIYPDILSINQLKRLKSLDKFIPYFDIPIQHSSPDILKRMNRYSDIDRITKLIKYIKNNFQNPFIRTNFIIGFPGETQKDFQHLLTYTKQNYFDNITVFQYHDEPTCKAYKLDNKITQKTINQRFKTITKLVNSQIDKYNNQRKNKTNTGIIENIYKQNNGIFIKIRPILHSPEMDPTDTININNVKSIYNNKEQLEVGTKIDYILT